MTAAAFEKPISGGEYTLPAAADLSAKQYFACKVDSTPEIALCSTAGERIDGILQNEPTAAQNATLMTHGITKVSLAGTVAIGNRVTTDAAGELLVATSGDYYIGRMLQAGVNGVAKAMRIERGVIDAIIWDFHVALVDISDADVLTDWTPGYAGVIEKLEFIVSTPVTTASKTTAVHAEIGSTTTTGGTVTVTSALATPLGKVIASGAAITAANVFTATDTISLVAAVTTAHAEGTGTFRLTVRNEPL